MDLDELMKELYPIRVNIWYYKRLFFRKVFKYIIASVVFLFTILATYLFFNYYTTILSFQSLITLLVSSLALEFAVFQFVIISINAGDRIKYELRSAAFKEIHIKMTDLEAKIFKPTATDEIDIIEQKISDFFEARLSLFQTLEYTNFFIYRDICRTSVYGEYNRALDLLADTYDDINKLILSEKSNESTLLSLSRVNEFEGYIKSINVNLVSCYRRRGELQYFLMKHL